MKSKYIFLLVLVPILAIGVFYIYYGKASAPKNISGIKNTSGTTTGRESVLQAPTKTPHYLGNAPSHEAVLPGAPINIVIDFDFDLGKGSSIKVVKDGVDFGRGESVIDPSGLSLRRKVDENSPDGLYLVVYNACWPDGSCHEGNFQFNIERGVLSSFINLKGKAEIVIPIENYSFTPPKIIVSKGAKVSWQNRDRFSHTINSDPHPGHTYFQSLNSRILSYNDVFSVVLDDPGVYLYHCSVHPNMSGIVFVE